MFEFGYSKGFINATFNLGGKQLLKHCPFLLKMSETPDIENSIF